MAQVNLKKIFENFEEEINNALALIKNVNLVKTEYAHSQPKLTQSDVSHVVELSFIKIFLAWEKFIEDAFIKHMLNVRTRSRRGVVCYMRPKNYAHALDILRGNRAYPEWSPDIVKRKAKLFFKDGKPFDDNLTLIYTDLEEMRIIRNSIVHMSQNSEEKFRKMVRTKLGYFPRRYTPGKFLLNLKSKRPMKTYLQSYTDGLLIIAKRIIS